MALTIVVRHRNILILLSLVLLAAIVLTNRKSEYSWSPSLLCDCPACPDRSAHWKTFDPSLMTAKDVVDYFHWSNHTSCGLTHDFGGVMVRNPSSLDGNKAICLDPHVAPKTGSCIVYSFGVRDDWSFEELMEKYGCEIFAFDPSLKNTKDHDRTSKIHFYLLGLSGSDTVTKDGWKLKTLSSLYEMLKPKHGEVAIDYLKIDIEWAEWDAFPQILQSGMIHKVRQLGVEFHWTSTWTLDGFRNASALIKAIEDSGMIRFDSKINPTFVQNAPALNYTGNMAYELAWYRVLPY